MNINVNTKEDDKESMSVVSENLFQLKADEFSKVLKLYKKSKHQIPMIQSVIDRKLAGKIFADEKINPQTIVVITHFNWMYVIGNQESENFKNQFKNFIVNELVPKCDQFAWFGLSDYWQDKLTEMFGDNIKSFPRVKYELDEEVYRERSSHSKLSDGYKVELIDSHLVDKASEFFDGIKMFWGTNENFLKSSFGFCMMHDNDVISVCQALAITEDVCEIDILTKDSYRGKSLAYFPCSAFIEHCLKSGLKPYWETVRANTSSCRLAEKLGFVEVEEYPFYAWFKNR